MHLEKYNKNLSDIFKKSKALTAYVFLDDTQKIAVILKNNNIIAEYTSHEELDENFIKMISRDYPVSSISYHFILPPSEYEIQLFENPGDSLKESQVKTSLFYQMDELEGKSQNEYITDLLYLADTKAENKIAVSAMSKKTLENKYLALGKSLGLNISNIGIPENLISDLPGTNDHAYIAIPINGLVLGFGVINKKLAGTYRIPLKDGETSSELIIKSIYNGAAYFQRESGYRGKLTITITGSSQLVRDVTMDPDGKTRYHIDFLDNPESEVHEKSWLQQLMAKPNLQ